MSLPRGSGERRYVPPSEMASVGDGIGGRRLQLGLSQRELACEGVSYAYISRIEANTRRPSVRVLRKLAPKLAVSAHWLETGLHDPATQLAQLVLDHRGHLPPKRAITLAGAILRDSPAKPG